MSFADAPEDEAVDCRVHQKHRHRYRRNTDCNVRQITLGSAVLAAHLRVTVTAQATVKLKGRLVSIIQCNDPSELDWMSHLSIVQKPNQPLHQALALLPDILVFS